MLRLTCVLLGLAVASFITLWPGAPEKAEAKLDKTAAAPEKSLTKEEQLSAETLKAIAPMVRFTSPKEKEVFVHTYQEGQLPHLRTSLLEYEHKLMVTPANNPQVQASHAWQVAGYEKLVCDGAKLIIDLDPKSEFAKQARLMLRRFELLKKNGPTT